MFLQLERIVMIKPSIEEYICRELLLDEQEIALDFNEFLKENNLIFYKDNCDCWKNKIYYWVKLDDECVCFIAIKDPDEKDNHWTVWSDDMGSEWLEQCAVENIINEFNIKDFEVSNQKIQSDIINELKANIKILTAERIYKYYLILFYHAYLYLQEYNPYFLL